jgi:hypothetical protein
MFSGDERASGNSGPGLEQALTAPSLALTG